MPPISTNKMKSSIKRLLYRAQLTQRVGLIIAGVQKGATTSLHHALKQHSHIHTAASKEVGFWNFQDSELAADLSYDPAKYNLLFPTTTNRKKVLLDSTPHYILDQGIPSQILKYNPKCKFIINLRNPAERLMSAFRMCSQNWSQSSEHIAANKVETRPIEEVVDYELGILNKDKPIDNSLPPLYQQPYFLPHSFYSRNLKRFIDHTPPLNLMINIIEEDLYPDTEKFIHQVENFVGIPHENLQMGKLNTTKNRTTVLPSNLSRLFDEEIKTLQIMLGRELHSWIQ